jgi:hypothetical protein
MDLRKSGRQLILVGAVVAAAVLGTSSAAFAGIGVSTTGASLYCNTYNDGGFRGHADCWLSDTSADSHSVYALLQVDGYATHRYNNTGGNGTTLNFTDRFSSDVVHWDYHYKVCRNVQFGSDNCSGWVHVRA